ncbi:MAG: multidrug effflux MFS transporter [Thermodesulfobacteriota bacterium]
MLKFVLLLALLTAFPPLATDMYLPVIPHLQTLWQKPLAVVNLTLVLFFITYCFFLLVYGPLSDRFGRKPPLIAGLLLFIAASLLCAASPSINWLIGARIFQAMGAAAASAISMAMAKDRLTSGTRERVLSQIAIIMALAPMIAPMIGSLIMDYLSWPWIFIFQAGMGMVALVGVFKTAESHSAEQGSSIQSLIHSYHRVLTNLRLVGVVACNALVGLPLFAFIAGSAPIYISRFGMDEKQFSLFFGANALCFMIGSMVCLRFGKRLGTLKMITIGYSGIGIGGIIMLSPLFDGPWRLALPIGLATFCLGLCRPPSNNLALEQVGRDAGTASSAMVFTYFVFGAFAMAGASLQWTDKIDVIGWTALAAGGTALTLWLLIRDRLHLPS